MEIGSNHYKEFMKMVVAEKTAVCYHSRSQMGRMMVTKVQPSVTRNRVGSQRQIVQKITVKYKRYGKETINGRRNCSNIERLTR